MVLRRLTVVFPGSGDSDGSRKVVELSSRRRYSSEEPPNLEIAHSLVLWQLTNNNCDRAWSQRAALGTGAGDGDQVEY